MGEQGGGGKMLNFKLLFIVLFLGIISWKSASRFNGGVCFSDGRASFLSGATPHEGTSVLMGGGGGWKKFVVWEGAPPCSPLWKPCSPPHSKHQHSKFCSSPGTEDFNKSPQAEKK